MAQQTLQTIIAIGGRIDNSFGQLGTQLSQLGSQIDTISRKLLDFGQESLETYVNYDDAMRAAQAAGKYSDAQMKALDKYNAQIAKTTTYSNLQAANAEVIMGQLGMSVDEIQLVMPAALRLAMAGNLSLADSINYLYSTLNATGHGYDYAATFVDQMTQTANMGATSIDTLGESLERLGSGAQMFKGGTSEIFTILNEMSHFGKDQQGSEGGTWLRNFALSLVATEADLDALAASWRALGMSEEEIADSLERRRIGLAATSIGALEAAGMKRYDAEGNLLPMIDIIKSMRDAVYGSGEWSGDLTELTGALDQAGGDIDAFTQRAEGLKDNELYPILRQIFSKRGITTALNLLSISDEDWDAALGEVINSEGVAQSVVDIMQDGLGGAQRGLDAAYTEFKTTVGETLEPWATELIGFLDGVVTNLDEIDPSGMQALTAALIPLAAAGPALVGAGTFFRLVGYALGPAGGIVVGALALTGAVMALNSLRESDIKSSFGDMDLDMESLGSYVTGLGAAFSESYADVTNWTTALDTAVKSYNTASSEFSSKLLTDMLTGKTLTEPDKDALLAYGQQMGDQLGAGILSATSASMTNIARLFGGEELAAGNENYQILMGALESSKSEMLANAAAVSQGLRDELLSAFEDGQITENEYAKIKAWFDAYNKAVAQIARETQSEEDAVNLQILLHKGQTGSLEDAKEYGNQILTARDDVLTTLEDDYLRDYYRAKLALDERVARGGITTASLKLAEQEEAALAALGQKHREDVEKVSAPYTAAYQRLWDTVLGESDLGSAFEMLNALAEQVLGGTMTPEMADREFKRSYGNGTYWSPEERAQLAEVLGNIISAGGGEAYYAQNPDLQKYLTMEYLAKGWFGDYANQYLQTQAGDSAYVLPDTFNRLIAQNYTPEAARAAIEQLGLGNTWTTLSGYLESGMYGAAARQQLLIPQDSLDQINYIVSTLGEVYDLEAVKSPELKARYPQGGAFSDLAAAWELMYGGASQNAQDFLLTQEPLSVPVEPDILVDPAMGEAQRKLDANPGTWFVNTQIRALDALAGKTTETGVNGKYKGFLGFAEGGYADVPSIFGEAGGEWAIPQEHSDRTAALLNAAREGSGFTWPDLIGRTGGLNADANHTPAQLIYSPTIIVKDARGVREALDEDRERLDKWFREKQLRDEIEVYS